MPSPKGPQAACVNASRFRADCPPIPPQDVDGGGGGRVGGRGSPVVAPTVLRMPPCTALTHALRAAAHEPVTSRIGYKAGAMKEAVERLAGLG